MDSSIRQRLLRAEHNLLDAVAGESLEIFAESWMSLYTDIEMALEAQLLDEDTGQLAHATASRVQIIVDGFLESYSKADAVAGFLEMTLSSLSISKDNEDNTTRDSTPDSSSCRAITSYIETAYEWLIRNLHNPYPPKHIKEEIARDTGSAIKDLDNWFIDARRRIGWNQLRRKRFSNKRQEIVRAATKFFTGSGCSELLDPDIEMEFAAIEASASQLYPNKIILRPELAEQTNDSSDETKLSKRSPHTRRAKPDNNGLQPSLPYELAVHPGTNCSGTNNSRKRQFDHDTVDSEPEFVSSVNLRKQLKLGRGSGRQQQQGICTTSPSITSSIRQPGKRKRGLSQSEGHPDSAKRPCSAPGSQTHTELDALFYDVPLDTSALDAWFQINWDITQPFDTALNDSDTVRDNIRLELFNPSQSEFPVINSLPQTNNVTQHTKSNTPCKFNKLDNLPELDASSIASTSSSPSSQTNVMPPINSTSDLDHWTDSYDVNTVMQNLSWLFGAEINDHLLPPLLEENTSTGILQDPNTLFNFDITTCGECPQVNLGLTSTIRS